MVDDNRDYDARTRDPDYDTRPRGGGSSTILILAVIVVLAVIAAFAFGLIDINQTKTTKLPEVKAEGGQMPAFDVNTAKVDVGTKNTSVAVPKVEVGTTNTSVALPTVDVKKAK